MKKTQTINFGNYQITIPRTWKLNGNRREVEQKVRQLFEGQKIFSRHKLDQEEVNNSLSNKEQGLQFSRLFSQQGVNPLDEIEYELRESKIVEPDGKVVFEMENIEIPKNWSQLATDIMASKYFKRAEVPAPEGRETSARQVVYRIAHTIRQAGENLGYFQSVQDADVFEAELSHILINQKAAFNSPVWFNCGLYHQYKIKSRGGHWYWDFDLGGVRQTEDSYSHPQCSACFIQSVDDDLMSIFDLVKNEAKLFKFGSGTGTNFSALRAFGESLAGGGTSSGLMSFLEILDRGAGAVKSGGITRRAAKMVILDIDHPDIEKFINWKKNEEAKAQALIARGYPADFNGEAYQTISGQNSNNSVRVSDEFMQAYLEDKEWSTTFRTTGKAAKVYKARDLMKQIAEAAWVCADPGLQFDDIINRWHTCSASGKIKSSNPCSEYMFTDDSACNLASVNLVRFLDEGGNLDFESFSHTIRLLVAAQEILVDFSSYPTEKIAENTHKFRPLGLGFANLGTLLMLNGFPYDSSQARKTASAISSILTSQAYLASIEIAKFKGTFSEYEKNKESMLRVMNQHREAIYNFEISQEDLQAYPRFSAVKDLLKIAQNDWDEVIRQGSVNGFRNAQVTCIAPTGTISLLMDCDTTGIEPEFAMVKFKKLAGGGHFKIINQSIPRALKRLGYLDEQVQEIENYILGHNTLNGAPYITGLDITVDELEKAVNYTEEHKAFDEKTPGINPEMLKEKGFSDSQIKEIKDYVEGRQTIEGAPHIKEEHLSIFDCANRCGSGARFIEPMGHIKMMAAVQPFVSGAISKTINLPNEATPEEIEKLYVESWKLGLKAVALYRDGCKMSQPLSSQTASQPDSLTARQRSVAIAMERRRPHSRQIKDLLKDIKKLKQENKKLQKQTAVGVQKFVSLQDQQQLTFIERGTKKDLPQKRFGFTLETKIGSQKIFLRTGEYEDGSLGEIFIDMHKEGAAYRSLLNCFAIAISIALQYGVPLKKFIDKFTFTRFEPNGLTDHPNIKSATSIIDFIFRVLGMEYLQRVDFVHVKPQLEQGTDRQEEKEVVSIDKKKTSVQENDSLDAQMSSLMGDAPVCDQCGHLTVRNGSCYKCLNCGNSLGCS